MFRPGLLTYGAGEAAERLGLKPVMTLKSTVGAVSRYVPDTFVSYGRAFRTRSETRLGVLPIGYADGLPRALSNKWQVWTPWGTAPIVGRICMDMCMVDVTDAPGVKAGDVATVYGPGLTDWAAQLAGTIPYELLCQLTPRIPRLYFEAGGEIR